MNAEGFYHLLPAVLGLVGFHGLFFYEDLVKKTGAWLIFQSGLVVFLLQIPSNAGPLPKVLALEAGIVGISVFLLLGVLCSKMWKKYKTLEGGEVANRVSK